MPITVRSAPRSRPFRRPRLLLAGVLLPALLAGCTSAGSGAVATSTSTATVAGTTVASIGTPAPGSSAGPITSTPAVTSATDSAVPSTPTTTPTTAGKVTTSPPTSPSTAAAPKTSVRPAPLPKVTISVQSGASEVSPVEPVTITAKAGTLRTVVMTNPEGRTVKGGLSADRLSWTSAEPLGYGREYALTWMAANSQGASSKGSSTFTTVNPGRTMYTSFFPGPKLKTVGVGQPMVVTFDQAPTDRVAAEKALSVTTVPAVKGSWYWWDDRTLHYRAENYWKPGTRITVSANIYGVDLGDGVYGETDRTMTVTIGKSKIARVDDATKQMEIFVDDKKVRTVPVSLGRNKSITVAGTDISFVTPSGTYVAQEKYPVKKMNSASYGLPVESDLGYDKEIPLAVRFSNEGIFVHSAPWSVEDQGVRNVSHGCINVNPKAAKWFFDNFGYGDILTVKGTSTKLAPTDGYGDWNIAWSRWKAGSALA